MGRIKTTWMKSIANELYDKFPGKFGENFEENKKFLESLKLIEDKSIRNKVAGYIIRVANKEE